MKNTELLGHVASILTGIAYVPQVYQTWRTKNVTGLSFGMISIVCISTLFWLSYGLLLWLWPVIICNSVLLILTSFLVYFKIIYRNSNI